MNSHDTLKTCGVTSTDHRNALLRKISIESAIRTSAIVQARRSHHDPAATVDQPTTKPTEESDSGTDEDSLYNSATDYSSSDEEDFINPTYNNDDNTCTNTQVRKRSTRKRMIPQKYQHAPDLIKRMRLSDCGTKDQGNGRTTTETINLPQLVQQSGEAPQDDTNQRTREEQPTLDTETSPKTKNPRSVLSEGGAHTRQSKRRRTEGGTHPTSDSKICENTQTPIRSKVADHQPNVQKDHKRPIIRRKRKARQQLKSPEPKRQQTETEKTAESQPRQHEPNPMTQLNTPFDRGKLRTRSRTNPSYKSRRGGHTANRR
jgi:hypothetical protein